jgi:predicted SAM-dependent methyltransferase
MRHLVWGFANGLGNLDAVVEIGPGPSLGTGLAALLSGADRYYALDFTTHASTETNLATFDELVALFQQRAPVPDTSEFPTIQPTLESYAFPHHILSEERLAVALHPERLAALRDDLAYVTPGVPDRKHIFYFAPWDSLPVVLDATVDMIYSQAVLEHVDEPGQLYTLCYRWLKPGGLMSHQIDFKSHGTARAWNGHWTYSHYVWKLFIRAKRGFLLNREPHSRHIALMRRIGFEVVCDRKVQEASPITRQQLAAEFQRLTDDDLVTSGAFIQALRR